MFASSLLCHVICNSWTPDWHSRVRNDCSRSSKVDDFHANWKGLCDFLL